MRRGTMFWGFFLVIIGLILLLDNLGLFRGINVWSLIWPIVLILFGIRVLFGTLYRRAPTTEHASIPLEGAQRASLRMQHGAGRIRVQAGTAPGILAEGDFTGGVDIQSQREGDRQSVKLRVSEHFFPFDWTPGNAFDWSINLSQEIPLELEFETGAGEARLDLTELRVSDLWLKSGASSTSINLPANAGHTRVKIEAGAASVDLNVPQGVAARIRSQGGLSSIKVDPNRFPSSGTNLYQSEDYDTAANKIEMDIQMGVGSVNVN